MIMEEPGGDPDSDPDDGDGGGYGRGGSGQPSRGVGKPSQSNYPQSRGEQNELSKGQIPSALQQKAQKVQEAAQNDNDSSMLLRLASGGVLGITAQKSEQEQKQEQEQARTQLKEGLKQQLTDEVAAKLNIPVVVIHRAVKEEAILSKATQWIKDNPLEAAELGLMLIPGVGLATRGAMLAGKGVRWGAKLLLNGKRIRNLAGLKQIYDVGSKASQKFVNWLPKSWRKALSNSKARSTKCTTVQEAYTKLQGGKDVDKLQKAIEAKIPEHFTESSLTRGKGGGIRWKNSNNNNETIRIDVGNPNARYESGKVDHVAINLNGKTIGRNGQIIEPTLEFPKPTKNPAAHIPLQEWIKWKSWCNK